MHVVVVPPYGMLPAIPGTLNASSWQLQVVDLHGCSLGRGEPHGCFEAVSMCSSVQCQFCRGWHPAVCSVPAPHLRGPMGLNIGCNVQCIVHVAGSLLLLDSTGQRGMECQAFGQFAWCVWTQPHCCTRVCKDGSVTESVDLAHYSCAECCRRQHVLWLRYFFLLTYMAPARAVGFAGRLKRPVGLLVRHKSAVRCCADWLTAVSMSLGVRQD